MAGRPGQHTIERIERQERALNLRKAGTHYRDIAGVLDCSTSTAHELVQEALTAMIKEPAKEVRDLEVARLDEMLKALWPAVVQGRWLAVDRALRIMERRAALLGLDAPQRRIVEVVTQDEMVRIIEGLERELAQFDLEDAAEGVDG